MTEAKKEECLQPSQVYVREGVWQRTGFTYTEFMSMGVIERDEFIALINQKTVTCPRCMGKGRHLNEEGTTRWLQDCTNCKRTGKVPAPWYRPWTFGIDPKPSK